MMAETVRPLPKAEPRKGLRVLAGLARDRSPLTALTLMREWVGQAFEIPVPNFRPAVFVGPEANRQILITDRTLLSWRNASDPVVRLLRRGVLVVDGAEHDRYRQIMDPVLQRRNVLHHIPVAYAREEQESDDHGRSPDRPPLTSARRGTHSPTTITPPAHRERKGEAP